MLERESAMGIRQKLTILSNELTRRLYNVDEQLENVREEMTEIMEKFTNQAKNSGWKQKECREMVISGYLGWKRRVAKRKREGGETYRSASCSLTTRTRMKLTGRENWYKTSKRKRDEDEEEEEEMKERYWIRKKRKQESKEDQAKIISVMFVPCTHGGELARRLREAETELGNQTGFKIKIVERSGTRIVDILHKANPWQGADCQRPRCLICSTKQKTEKDLGQDCSLRNIVYETWCLTCEKRNIEKIMKEEEDFDYENEKEREEERKRRLGNIKKYKYIGESSRSAYERGIEHQNDWENLKDDSHMVKHYIECHEEEEMEEMIFGMRIVKAHKTAFTRQISESVIIQSEKQKHVLLNLKSEYNRCALPRLTAQIGEETLKKFENKNRKEKEEEKELEKKVRVLRSTKNKKNNKYRRENATEFEQPAGKRRRINEDDHKRVLKEKEKFEKRKETPEEENFFPIFVRKKAKLDQTKQEIEEIEETRWEKAWTEEEWKEKIKEMEKNIKEEEILRKKRIDEARRKEKTWELLRLCRRTIEEEGSKWKVSKERREMEREAALEREERLLIGRQKGSLAKEKHEKKEKQEKITKTLNKLPENRRKLVKAQLEKERRIEIKEAREEIWKKYRQNKGKKGTDPRKKSTINLSDENLDRKLEKIECEVKKIEKEREERQKAAKEKEDRIERKKRLEKKWEMLRWVVQYIDTNKDRWERERLNRLEIDKEEEEIRKIEEDWLRKNETEKKEAIKLKELTEPNENKRKEERLAEARRLKESWRKIRSKTENDSEEEEDDQTHHQPDVVDDGPEPGEEEPWSEDEMMKWMGIDERNWCLDCANSPCLCALVKLEIKLKILKESHETEEKIEEGKETEVGGLQLHHHPMMGDDEAAGQGGHGGGDKQHLTPPQCPKKLGVVGVPERQTLVVKLDLRNPPSNLSKKRKLSEETEQTTKTK